MKNTNKKLLIVTIAALVLAIACVVGTVAYLTATTEKITNTFTYGKIKIELKETTGTEYKIVPNTTISKDPKVSVLADSDACWLYVKVEKSEGFDTYLEYTMADGWTKLEGTDDIWCRNVNAETAKTGSTYSVLSGDQVKVPNTVSSTDIDDLISEKVDTPTLSFTAYAVQAEGFATAQAAWSATFGATAVEP